MTEIGPLKYGGVTTVRAARGGSPGKSLVFGLIKWNRPNFTLFSSKFSKKSCVFGCQLEKPPFRLEIFKTKKAVLSVVNSKVPPSNERRLGRTDESQWQRYNVGAPLQRLLESLRV